MQKNYTCRFQTFKQFYNTDNQLDDWNLLEVTRWIM